MSFRTRAPLCLAQDLVVAVGLCACSGEPVSSGLEEPIRVLGGQFRQGALPGHSPLTVDEIKAGKQPKKPYSTPVDVAGSILSENEIGFSVGGRASTDSYSVALQLKDAGSGYWVLPVGSPDPANGGELSWRTSLDLGPVEPGMHDLMIAAIDGQGRSGTQRAFEFCVRSEIEDNLNACVPTREPPGLVVSLGWNNKADLDLLVLDEAGNRISANSVQSADAGRLERDANANCRSEGTPRENVVWDKKPKAGLYYIYVNLSDPCSESSAAFTVSTHVSKSAGGGEFKQVETYNTAGELLATQASNAGLGTFVTEFSVK